MAERASDSNQSTVLVIEDDQDMNELVCAILDTAGYDVQSADNGKDGFEKALEFKPDLILLDIMLPEVDGIEVCRSLSSHEDTRHIPVIMLTLKRELSVKLSSYIAGAKRYITKPFGVEDLLNEVRNTLRQPGIPPETGQGPPLMDMD